MVAGRGFSSQTPAATAAWTDGAAPVGTLGGLIAPGDLDGDGLVEVVISEDDALRKGLACGSTASVLVRHAAALPAGTWDGSSRAIRSAIRSAS